jgi:hypothetical protein
MYEWPFAALAIGLVVACALLVRPRWRDPEWLVCWVLPIYMLHQFEEHGYNLLGQRFHFLDELCTLLGHPRLDECPADPAFVLAVNVGGVWIQGLLAIVYRRRNPMVGACALGTPLINVLAHVGPAFLLRGYDSGLLTALALFVPYCFWTLRIFRRNGLLDEKRLAIVIASGVLTHAILAASVFAKQGGLIGEPLFLALNVAYGFLPLAGGALVNAFDRRGRNRPA